jgi:type VI secretion system protein ImpH
MDPVELLLADGPTWSFVRAVAVAEAAAPEGLRIGTTTPPARELVRLRPALSLAFPSSDVAGAERLPKVEDQPARLRIETAFLGVYGQASPLPSYVSESLLGDETGPARDFIDIFNHRMLSLAYRVLTKYRVERSRGHAAHLRALTGAPPDVPAPQLPGQQDMLAIAGLLAQQPRSAAALATALGCWLGGVPVEIEQCAPTWTPLPPERQGVMGTANCRIGSDCLAGERILSCTTAFRVHIGPVGADVFRRFLPGGDGMTAVSALVAEFNADQLDWDVQVRLAADAMPPASLGESARLGWDARLDGPPPDNASITITA